MLIQAGNTTFSSQKRREKLWETGFAGKGSDTEGVKVSSEMSLAGVAGCFLSHNSPQVLLVSHTLSFGSQQAIKISFGR